MTDPDTPTPPPEEQAELVCGQQQAQCICSLSPGHDGPHSCMTPLPVCGGEWTYDDAGELVVLVWPGGSTSLTEAIVAMLGFDTEDAL